LLEYEIQPSNVTVLAQAVLKLSQVRLARGFEIAEKAYAGHPPRLLRLDCERRGEEATRYRSHEPATLHYSIT
jgi:hypothetical protein